MKEMVGGCCVCSDDRGWSENPLVYCDGQNCAVAVHQACYGIVSVPSGPWYCRKCESQERSARVRCELCPSRDGALKKTDNQGWAHVVCALYIPEVRFGNVTTMEPIILQLIPQERFNKICYICQELGKGSRANAGACMQCNKSGCKQQFHVTCAQQLGLLCEEAGNYLDNVKYCGYCQHHYSKLKKGGNVKTIPPYKPVSHETNSSDGPSSPEKELEPAATMTSGAMKSSRLPIESLNVATSSSSSSSKQRKSSSTTKGSSQTTSSSSSSLTSLSSSNNVNNQSSSSSSLTSNPLSSSSTQVAGPNPSVSGGVIGGNIGSAKSGSSSVSSGNKDKDKYSKNVNKTASTNKSHDKESSSSSSSSSSSQRDKSSKSSKTNKIDDNLSSSSAPLTTTSAAKSSNISSSSDKAAPPPSSSSSSNTTRAASLSPAAIPTTLIIKQSHEKDVINSLNKEAIAKFTTSNFTETIVVNSDSVFGTSSSGSVAQPPDGSKSANVSAPSTNKKRKAGSDSRSTPTTSNMEVDINNRDLIKDVAVSLVPLPHMNKNENIDTSSLSGIDKIKKAKTESNSPHHVPMEPNLQNVSPNVISQSSNIISSQSSTKPQTQVITQNIQNPLIKPAVLKDERQMMQQNQGTQGSGQTSQNQQPTTPSLVVSVPLSTAQVPGVNLPSNSNTSSSSTSTIISPNPLLQSSSANLFQHHISQRNQEQLMSATSSRSSPIVQQNVIHHQQNIMERESPIMSGVQLSTDHHHGVSVLQSVSPIPLPVVQSASSSSPATTNDGGLKISYEKQTNSRIASLLQEEEAPGRRSRSQSGDSIGGSKNRSSKSKRSNQRSSPPDGNDVNLSSLSLPASNNSSSSNNTNISSSSTNSSHTNITSGSNIKMDHQTPQPPLTAPAPPITTTNINNTISTNSSHPNKKIRLQNVPEIPSPSSSRTPDNHFTSNTTATSSYQVVGSSGGLKFTYESQSSSAITTHPVLPAQQVVKESPPSSPGSDSGTATTVRSVKRNRKSSTNSNAVDVKDTKLFQNGVPTASHAAAHMLGNQLNPTSSMSAKLSEHLNMEIEAHSVYAAAEPMAPLIGPQFPGKNQAARSMPTTTNIVNTGNPLANMLSGAGTTNGNTPQSLEQLLERQWEQGSQFLMEQAQHFDIASLLSCLHQLRTENVRLEEHVNNLVARRDHLLAVNARLAIPLNPNVVGSGNSSTSGVGAVGLSGQQGQFNNIHINGPIEPQTTSQTNRSSRLQQQNIQHFSGNQMPVENGLDFRQHSSNSSTIRRSGGNSMNDRSSGTSGGGAGGSYPSQQQTIYNTAHQVEQYLLKK